MVAGIQREHHYLKRCGQHLWIAAVRIIDELLQLSKALVRVEHWLLG